MKKDLSPLLLIGLVISPVVCWADSPEKKIFSNIDHLSDLMLPYAISTALAVIIFCFGILLSNLIVRILRRLILKRKIEETISKFLCRILHAILIIFVVLATLSQLGVQTASLVAILGAMSLAVGLSLKSSLSNLASGLLLILFRPIKSGEYIKISNVQGTVDEINLLYTELLTPDNQLLIIPNSKFMNDVIYNYNAKKFRRCDITIGIGYSDDISRAKIVLSQILDAESRIVSQPSAPVIAVDSLGDSTVNIIIQYFTKTTDYLSVKRQITENIKNRFDQESINLPYPQMDIHITKE